MTDASVYFIDSNALISAVDKDSNSHRHCLELIDRVAKLQISAATSLETLEETLYILTKLVSRKDALRIVRNFMLLPGLSKYPMNLKTLMQAMEVMEIYPLTPKDAINIATMLENNIRLIVSDDKDYDKAGLVQRIHPQDLIHL
jgi:predicted nucleic acid-binding protein